MSHCVDGQSQALRRDDACPGHAKPGSSPAKHISSFQSVNSHVGLGLQPGELPAPEGKLSVSGELIPSSLPRHLPPATWQRHMAPGVKPAGAPPGRLCREPWELRFVGGNRIAHAQVHSRARAGSLIPPLLSLTPPHSLSLILSPSFSLILLFSILLILSCSP